MVTYYCTSCWHESQVDTSGCPNCGASKAFCTEKMYADTLMNSLTHPVRDYRLIAVQGLGNIRYEPAEPYLASIIRTEGDREIVKAAAESIQKIHGYRCQDSEDKVLHNRYEGVKKLSSVAFRTPEI